MRLLTAFDAHHLLILSTRRPKTAEWPTLLPQAAGRVSCAKSFLSVVAPVVVYPHRYYSTVVVDVAFVAPIDLH